MARQSDRRKHVVERVMHAWKRGALADSAGQPVTDHAQAIAMALSEAGASNRQSPKQNRRRLAQSEAKEARGDTPRQRAEGDPTRAELYEEAKRRDLPGRSRMNKAELAEALKP